MFLKQIMRYENTDILIKKIPEILLTINKFRDIW